MAFETKKPKEDLVITGFNIHKDLLIKIKLYAVTQSTSASDIMRDVLREEMKSKPTTAELIETLAKNAHKEWCRLCEKNFRKQGWQAKHLPKRYKSFIEKARTNLKKRGVWEEIIDMVVDQIDRLEIDQC